MRGIIAASLACALVGGCVGTTGGEVIDFPAAAAGPVDADAIKVGFVTDRGWRVVLTKATLHVGAVYLSQSQPVSGAQATACVLPGTYVAQVTSGLDVDLLSPAPQRFPTLGHGTTFAAIVGQVWLAGGASDHDVDQASDTTPILAVEGTADRAGDVRPFAGQITIASNRVAQGGPVAGADTLCRQRIVSPIEARLTVGREGGLLLRVDPRELFVNVDFSALARSGDVYAFSDDPGDLDPTSPTFYSQPSANLYQNLHAAGPIAPLYVFSWEPGLR